MNERDRALGRLLLQRNLCSREALQQAGQTTLARRQAGQQAELVVVLVEMGALTTEVGRQLWAEVASVPTQGGAQPAPAPAQPAPVARPPAPRAEEAGSGEFSPVSTLSTMGEAPPSLPPGYDPLGSRGFGAPPRPTNGFGGFGGFGAPPAEPVAPDEVALDDVSPVGGGFAPPPFGGSATGSFGGPPPGGTGTFGAPPATGSFGGGFQSGFESAPTFRGNLANAFEPDGGAPGFGGGFGGFGAPPAPPGGDFGGFGPPPAPPGGDFGDFGGFGPPPAPPGGDFGGFGPPPAPPGGDFGGFGAPPAPPGGDFGGFGAPPAPPGGDFGGFGPPPAPPGGDFGGFGPPPAPSGGDFGAFGAPAAPPGDFGGFGAPSGPGGDYGFGAPLPPAPPAKDEAATKGSQRAAKKGGSGRNTAPGASSARLSRTRAGAPPPRGGGPPVALIAVCVVVGVAVIGGAAFALKGQPAQPPTTTPPPPTTTSTATPTGTETPGEDDPRPPVNTGPGGQATKLVAPDAPPATKAETDNQSWQWADHLLIQAWDLREAERYDDAIKALEGFPTALRGGEGFLKVQEKLAEYARFAGYKRKLEEAIAAGGASEALRSLVGRIEAGNMESDLLALPCTSRFKEEARRVLGPATYDEIAVKAMDLPTEIPSGED